MTRASSSPWLCLPLLLLVIAAVFVALPVAACAGNSNDAGDSTGSGRKPASERQKELLGQEGAPSQRRAAFTLPYSCGGCTWSKTNGTLSMAGASDCGSGCPATLEFQGLSITSVDAGAFNSTGLQHVTQLHLYKNQLTSLPSGIFDQLTALTILWLDGNQLTSVPSGIFDKLTALTYLSLWDNQLTSVPSGIFDELTALTKLLLQGNQLTSVPSGIFDQLTALTELDLADNPLKSVPSGIFDKLTALTLLYLYSNQLTSVPSGIFDQLTGLTYLRLDHNQLTSVPSGIFDKLAALTELLLQGNQLTSLPSGIFDQLTALTDLYLDVADTWACSVTIPVPIPLGPYDYRLENSPEFDISTYNALPLCLSVTQGLESDACVNETRTMKEIISGGREASGGFFQGGLGGKAQGDWETYGCWRRHACLDFLNAAGIDTTGDAICYKFNSAQLSWLLWGLQSSLNLQCSSD